MEIEEQVGGVFQVTRAEGCLVVSEVKQGRDVVVVDPCFGDRSFGTGNVREWKLGEVGEVAVDAGSTEGRDGPF